MSSEKNPLRIPYRLETPELVASAMDRNVVRIEKNYERILQAQNVMTSHFTIKEIK